MKILNIQRITIAILALFLTINFGCKFPKPKGKTIKSKHNYIVLLDLSDRLIVQDKQAERDKEIIKELYKLYENRVRRNLYIKSRDEIKVVMAPQKGSHLSREVFEDRLYINMENIKNVYRKPKEKQRRDTFFANIDSLYKKAVFSDNPKNYDGADIWKYFYEDLKIDYAKDTLTQNFLFILTDGYPVVGQTQVKLQNVRDKYPDLHIILIEAAPREEDMEWDRIISIWEDWFNKIGVEKYTLIKRGAISKEIEEIEEIVDRI